MNNKKHCGNLNYIKTSARLFLNLQMKIENSLREEGCEAKTYAQLCTLLTLCTKPKETHIQLPACVQGVINTLNYIHWSQGLLLVALAYHDIFWCSFTAFSNVLLSFSKYFVDFYQRKLKSDRLDYPEEVLHITSWR